MKTPNTCYKCGIQTQEELEVLFDYTICTTCRKKLGLFTDETLKRHNKEYDRKKAEDPSQRDYQEEVAYRLDFIKKDYISSKIKLLYIQQWLDDQK